MKDQDKTKEDFGALSRAELIKELAELRQRAAELEAADTERQRVEEALRENEEKVRAILDASPDVIHLLDINGIILSVNEGYARRLGLERDDMIGKSVFDFTLTELVHNRKAALDKVFRTGEPLQLEDRGLTGVFEGHVHPVFNPEGEVTAVAVYARDITECRRAEEELRESEKRYALATDAGQVGVWDWNLETDEIYLDPNLKAMLGYADHEIRNHLDDWGKHVHPDDVEQVMAAADAHLKGLTPQYEVVHRMVHKDGSVRWFLARGAALRDADGKPYRVVGTDTDITERVQAEEKSRRFGKIMETTTQSVIITNIEGAVLYVNPAYYTFSGFQEDEVIGQPMFQFASDQGAEKLAEEVLPALLTQGNWRGEMFVVKKNEQIVPADLICSLLSDEQNQPEYFVAVFTDITERKQAEEELRKHREHLEELSAERTADLRKVVNAMAGREVRMAELKDVIRQLRAQLEDTGLTPVADDPLFAE